MKYAKGNQMASDNILSPVIFDRIYQDTFNLLIKSQRFMENHTSSIKKSKENLLDDLRVNCEITRITARLTQIMAWVAAQRSALLGEISFDQARSSQYSLGQNVFCLWDATWKNTNYLPPMVIDLLSASLSLYKRVSILSHQNMSAHQEEKIDFWEHKKNNIVVH
jgi:regulator of CtrA degradation